jgi:hypothetical protein
MSSQTQIDANRRNAQQSTGPRTSDGKAAVARNAIAHGFYSQHLVLPGEDEGELHALRQAIEDRLEPDGQLEALYVERIVMAAWKIRRICRAEKIAAQRWQITDVQELYRKPIDPDRYDRFAAVHERAMDKAVRQLQLLQKDRRSRSQRDDDEDSRIKPNLLSANDPADEGVNAGPEPSASMKIKIVKTNPIRAAAAPLCAAVAQEVSQIEGTNPIFSGSPGSRAGSRCPSDPPPTQPPRSPHPQRDRR